MNSQDKENADATIISSNDQPPPLPPSPPVPGLRIINIGITVGLFVLMAIIMRTMGSILKPLFVAIFLGYLLYPAIQYLKSRRVPGFMAYIIVFISIFGILTVLGVIITSNVTSIAGNLDDYTERFNDMFTRVGDFVKEHNVIELLGIEVTPEFEDLTPLEKLKDFLSTKIDTGKVTVLVGSGINSFFGFVGNSLMVLFFMIFVLLEMKGIPTRVRYAYGDDFETISEVTGEINKKVRTYLWVQTVIGLITGFLYALACFIVGVDFFLLWGILAFLLNYIPYIGFVIAAAFPVIIALILVSPLAALILLVIFVAIQFIAGNFIQPKILGNELNLSPLVVLIAMSFWGWFWGLVGMFLAIPITVIMMIIMEHIPGTRSIARLMSNVTD